MKLRDIIEPIKDDLVAFEQEYKSLLKSDIFLIDQIVHYLLSHRGKRLRPIIVLLISRMNGAPPTVKRLKAAAILELLHTATLVHDDVVDDTYRRRGFPSINSIWKNKVSVLMGDYLFSKSLLAMLHLGDAKAFSIISLTAERMSQGELLQLERSRDYWMEEAIYFRLIADKTASLISAACQLGGLAGEQSEAEIAAMGEFGEKVGIAFQIRDDLLDLLGEEGTVGKPVGNDIRENKITLPLLHALKQAKKSEAKEIIRLVRRGSTWRSRKNDYERIVNFIERQGGVAYAHDTARRFCDEALHLLSPYHDSSYKDALTKLVRFITLREN
ncbi:polyprenyl synthetase family protein [candidate division KSB1 bacterium]|nr:MAG: polyprenyl synthetase family protein [candidate division KSB1 bacterium]MBC6950892.1 polyprenyl synthetase family protein [candidate division KSB1 bacterium]MCE7941035.1 polyprenyl synthetase family protein [Chlorobi bacterium CHB1]MDL1877608.1 polyprenyl synthetase family protein [Cytophagia bacterium CHB2]